jgi:hypothetical protein
MKHLTILLVILIFGTDLGVAGETTNPVQSYSDFHALTGRVIYKWSVDLNNDSKQEVLLDTKQTAEEIAQETQDTKEPYNSNIHSFEVYIAKADGSGYVESTGINDGTALGVGAVPEVDITQCYVGQIDELHAYGLVTIHTGYPRKAPAVACIYAYTIESDHLKRRLLAQYDSTKSSNAIYDKYLKEGKRTHVTLQEVTP